MNRNVTAIYRNFETADLVQSELKDLGISGSSVHLIPDHDDPVPASGYRDDERYSSDLHALHLPDNDLRTYQQSVRRGDYVVSADVDDDYVQRAQDIMRRPEEHSYDLDSRDTEFADEALMAPSPAGSQMYTDEQRGRRNTESTDPYTRAYVRDAPLTRR